MTMNVCSHVSLIHTRVKLDTILYKYSLSMKSIYNLHRMMILLIDNFTVIWFVQCPSHIFYIINCHAKHETEDLQMDIHPGLGALATGN
jgi:hypothetical protein